METKHTKGPWKAVSALASVEFNCMEIAEVAYMRVVPECGGWPQQGTPEEDARLIAAAPELLEALIDALALIELVMPIEGDVTRNARKAIAKAEGR